MSDTPEPLTPEQVAEDALHTIATQSVYECSETREELHRIIDAQRAVAASALASLRARALPPTDDGEVAGMVNRLGKACRGHPAAKIPWPHRLLHDAIDLFARLDARVKEERLTFAAIEHDMNRTALAHLNRASAAEARLRRAEEVIRTARNVSESGVTPFVGSKIDNEQADYRRQRLIAALAAYAAPPKPEGQPPEDAAKIRATNWGETL